MPEVFGVTLDLVELIIRDGKYISMKFNKYYLKESKMNKIYVDLDGVLVDFTKGYEDLSGIKPKDAEKMYANDIPAFWKPINDAGYEWWANLDWTKDGKELWNYILPHNPTILTAPSKGEACPKGKNIWVDRELGVEIPVFIERDKYKYAEPNHILIDDTKKKIEDWVDAGGIGILHGNTKDTIKLLKEILV